MHSFFRTNDAIRHAAEIAVQSGSLPVDTLKAVLTDIYPSKQSIMDIYQTKEVHDALIENPVESLNITEWLDVSEPCDFTSGIDLMEMESISAYMDIIIEYEQIWGPYIRYNQLFGYPYQSLTPRVINRSRLTYTERIQEHLIALVNRNSSQSVDELMIEIMNNGPRANTIIQAEAWGKLKTTINTSTTASIPYTTMPEYKRFSVLFYLSVINRDRITYAVHKLSTSVARICEM